MQRRFETGDWKEGTDALAMLRETHEIMMTLKTTCGMSETDIEIAFRKRLLKD